MIFPPSHTRIKTALAALLAAGMLCFGSGCAGPHGAKASPEEALRAAVDISAWNLSPEAAQLYYYLLLSRSLAENDKPAAHAAIQRLLELDPSLEVYQDAAALLVSGGEPEKAASIAREGLKRFPDDPVLVQALAAGSSETGDTLGAIGILETHLKKHPKNPEVTRELVRLSLKTGDKKKALHYLGLLPVVRTDPEGLLFLARANQMLDRPAEAEKLLRIMTENFPDIPDGWIEFGLFKERSGNLADAADAYRKGTKVESPAPELFTRLFVVQVERGKAREAAEEIRKAPVNGDMLLQCAVLLADKKYFAEARSLAEFAAASGAESGAAQMLLSYITIEETGDRKAAAAPLRAVPESSALYWEAQIGLARLLADDGDLEGALAAAKKARAAGPDEKRTWGMEGFLLGRLKRFDEGVRLLEDAARKFPDDPGVLLTLGNMQDMAGKRKNALKTMERVIELAPQNAHALNYVGYTLADEDRDLNRAFELISAALAVSPDSDYIVDSLAWVLYRQGKYPEAWEAVRRCISLGGDHPAIWEHYGDIALAVGKPDEAVLGYQNALARDPENPDTLRKKLEKALRAISK